MGCCALPLAWLRNAVVHCRTGGLQPSQEPRAVGATCLRQPRGTRCRGLPPTAATWIFPWKHSCLKKTKPVLYFQSANSQPRFHNLHSSYEGGEIRGDGLQSSESTARSTTTGGDPWLRCPPSSPPGWRHAPARSKTIPVRAFKRLRAALCINLMLFGPGW